VPREMTRADMEEVIDDFINATRRADAHSELARWLAGNHAINNLDRAHAPAGRH